MSLHFSNRLIAFLLAASIISLGAEASLPPHPALPPSGRATSGTATSPKSPKSSGRATSPKSPKSSGGKTQNSKPKTQNSKPKSSAEAKRRQEETRREIERTQEQLRLNEQQVREGLSDLSRLSADIESGRRDVARLQSKVASLQTEISTLGGKIAEGEKSLTRMREEYLKAVKKMRVTKHNQSTLTFILASESFNQAMRRIRYLRQFSEWKERQSANIETQIKTLADQRQKLDQAREQETAALAGLETSQRKLESQHREQAKLVDKLKANGDMLQTHLRSKQQEANSLKESIAMLIAQEEQERLAREKAEADRRAREKAAAEKAAAEKAAREKAAAEKAAAEKASAEKAAADKKAADKKAQEERAKADKKRFEEEKKRKEAERKAQEKKEKKQKNSEKSSRRKKHTSTPSQPTTHNSQPTTQNSQPATHNSQPATSFAASKGSLPRPVDGGWRITNPFGRHAMPEMPEVVYDNPGIDAEVASGATAKAVFPGRVSGVYKVAGYGTVVIVNHGDYYTVYGNLSSVNVSVGSQVNTGQSLGRVAADPDDPRRSSIHFEVWHGRDKQNPASWLR